MRWPCIAALALLGPTAASAADLPRPAAAPLTAFVAAPTWSGFYVGVNAGYGFGRISTPTSINDGKMDGVIGGGQAGFNWQSGSFVLGVEGDIQATGMEYEESLIVLTGRITMPWFTTLRARAGFAFGDALIYLTAGGAYANHNVSLTALGVTVESSDSNFGYAAGGGVEWKVMPRVSVRGEYLYIDTGDTSVTLFGTTLTARSVSHIGRGAVNFFF